MKHIGDQHGGIHSTSPVGDGEGARSSGSKAVIVNLPDNFDINDAFPSEDEPLEGITPPPVEDESLETIAPPPVVVARAPSEPVSHDRVQGASLSIADLIDNHVRLEWHEAVAIAQHLCGVMARDPAANVHRRLVEPWNVEITNSGEVHVLPGGSSSDPLVKQVGRVLQALLQDSITPAELRLVASQASFEVPFYSSVDELSAALRHFERPGGLDAIRAAFRRGLDAKFSVSPTHSRVAPVAAAVAAPKPGDSSWTPKGVPVTSPMLSRSRSRSASRKTLAVAAAILVATALVTQLRTRTSEERPVVVAAPERQGPQVDTQPSASAEKREMVRAPNPPSVAQRPVRSAPSNVAPTVSQEVFRPRARPEPASVAPTASERSTAPTQRPTAIGAGESPEVERRAAGLLANGRADEAGIVFDALVMKDPFYQLDRARSSPEALAALRSSKRVLLPAMARRQYQEARAAFEAGDFSLAIANDERARALLNDLDSGAVPADLSAEVTDLLAVASAARAIEEERIYTIADSSVTPPRPLGRQLPTAARLRAVLQPTGRLEILVGQSGRVETVKLDTPSNGYHDRMIVSAVKAWHYRPALRNGKPVRFNLVMSINLPDS